MNKTVFILSIFLLSSFASARCSEFAYANLYEDTRYAIRKCTESPGITLISEGAFLPSPEFITAHDFKTLADLTMEAVVIVCNHNLSEKVNCTDGFYPLNITQETLDELNSDPDVIRYWGSADAYQGVEGQIGPSSQSLQPLLELSTTCGETYCRITVSPFFQKEGLDAFVSSLIPIAPWILVAILLNYAFVSVVYNFIVTGKQIQNKLQRFILLLIILIASILITCFILLSSIIFERC